MRVLFYRMARHSLIECLLIRTRRARAGGGNFPLDSIEPALIALFTDEKSSSGTKAIYLHIQ